MKCSLNITKGRWGRILTGLGLAIGLNLGAIVPPPKVPGKLYPRGQQIRYLSPQASMKQVVMPPGYHLQLVLSEPVIRDPVACVFDGDGRMYVAEMRSYMQDIDGKHEHTPVSRISLHVDTNGDGVYDRHTVFIDGLVLPRMMLTLGNALVVGQTDSNDLYIYRDTNGDGVADQKKLFFKGGPRGGNLEHQPSGLIWCMDNCLYTTYNAYRLRYANGKVVPEPTAPNGGQWGLTQDDYGKPWYVNAGGEIGPLNFQEPIVYGAFNVPDQLTPDFRTVWPLVRIPDVQGGPARFRPRQLTLNHFTATCGAAIFRGDRLPPDLEGDLLFAEPVGRLIRRTKIQVRDGLTYLRNAYPGQEFIRSTDPDFRPVNMITAPDGCLYIVDMYRGIIQEGNWVRPGSYLRGVVKAYGLQNNFGRGRIYRLVHDGYRPGPEPHMLEETSAQLVAHLAHPNGWWRDTAQKLLVVRHDLSVVPALEDMAAHHSNPLARLQALWTLEGLGALQSDFVRQRLKDPDPHVRAAAIRVSERLFKGGDSSLVPAIEAMAQDPDPNVAIQALMTAKYLRWPTAGALIRQTLARTHSRGVQEIGSQLLRSRARAPVRYSTQEAKRWRRGSTIYHGLCFACHGTDGKGAPLEGAPRGMTIAPPLAGSPTVLGYPDGVINVVLHGLTGPVHGKKYAALMVPMESNNDEWVASVVSFIRNSFGNHASFVKPGDVARVRRETRARKGPWTYPELVSVTPQSLEPRTQWKLAASENAQSVRGAIDGNAATRYDTGTPQRPGMWFRVEFPHPVSIAGLELDTRGSPGDYPRGYQVQVSDDGEHWGAAIASGHGSGPVTEIRFAPVRARFLRITQTGRVNGLYWSIHELHVFTAPKRSVSTVISSARPPPSPYE